MIGVLASLVPGKELLETVIASVVAGLGVTFAFSVGIWGVARFAEYSRTDKPMAATASALVAVVGLSCVGAALVFGLVVMMSK